LNFFADDIPQHYATGPLNALIRTPREPIYPLLRFACN
jgi:hypothetical protein